MSPEPTGWPSLPPEHAHLPGESSTTPRDIQRYLGRISGPLLDRIDLHVEVPAVKLREITDETSAQIRERVIAARQRQQERFKHKPTITRDARMGSREFKQYCPLKTSSATPSPTPSNTARWIGSCGREGLAISALDSRACVRPSYLNPWEPEALSGDAT
jgi:predicted ATPase with chaperone activity